MKYKITKVEIFYDLEMDSFKNGYYEIEPMDLVFEVDTEHDTYDIFRTISKITNEPLIIMSPLFAKTVKKQKHNRSYSVQYRLAPIC